MNKSILFIVAIFLLSCKTTTYYIVRHAEKESATTMTSDVPLTESGRQRAESLKELLINEKISQIYSTNYIRTRSTAKPLSDAISIPIESYDPRDTAFISKLKKSVHRNILVVGHSNTVDDLVNRIMGGTHIQGDLPESQYGDLFVIKRKAKKYNFAKKHYGL